MTAPDTNLEKQAKRHRPSLRGMAFAALAIGGIIVAVALWTMPTDSDGRGAGAAPVASGENS